MVRCITATIVPTRVGVNPHKLRGVLITASCIVPTRVGVNRNFVRLNCVFVRIVPTRVGVNRTVRLSVRSISALSPHAWG